MFVLDHGELIDREPVVRVRFVEVQHANLSAATPAVRVDVLHGDAGDDHPMEVAVTGLQRRPGRPSQPALGVFQSPSSAALNQAARDGESVRAVARALRCGLATVQRARLAVAMRGTPRTASWFRSVIRRRVGAMAVAAVAAAGCGLLPDSLRTPGASTAAPSSASLRPFG